MPIGRATIQVSSTAAIETTIVSQRRSPMTSVTGRCHSIAIPRSPRAIRRIQRAYWTYIGWSSAYSARNCCA